MSATTKQITRAIKAIAPYEVKFTGTELIVPGDVSIIIPFKTEAEFASNAVQVCDALDAFGVNFIPTVNGENVELRSGNRKIKMKVSPFDYHREDDLIEPVTVGVLDEMDVHRILIAKRYTSTDKYREAIRCVYIHEGNIVSTDSKRMYFTKASFETSEELLLREDTMKLLDCFAGNWTVQQDGGFVHLRSDDGILIIQEKQSERFVNWKAVIPKENPIEISFVNKELREALKQGGKFAGYTDTVVMECTDQGVKLIFEDLDLERDYSVDLNFAARIKGDDIRIGFNWKLLSQIISDCPDAFVMKLSASNRSAVIDDQFLLFPVLLKD